MATDLDALQGLWRRLKSNKGLRRPTSPFTHLLIEGDRLREIDADRGCHDDWTITIDASVRPHRLTRTSKPVGRRGVKLPRVQRRAYHLKGDVLRVSFPKYGEDYPSDVSDRTHDLLTFARESGPPPASRPREELRAEAQAKPADSEPDAESAAEDSDEEPYLRWPEILDSDEVRAAAAPLAPDEVDLEYDLATLCGPFDPQPLLEWHEESRRLLDPAYLRHLRRWHGGVPKKSWFRDGEGRLNRLARFLNFCDDASQLVPPLRPSWQFPGEDVRSEWSHSYIDGADQFFGEKLLPFAALWTGRGHSDHMCLDRSYVDFLCFYDAGGSRPEVVVWVGHEANQESTRREVDDDEHIRYTDFTIPVAPNFDAFLRLLSTERPA